MGTGNSGNATIPACSGNNSRNSFGNAQGWSVLSDQRHKKALVSVTVTARGRQFGTKHSVAEPTLVSTTLSEFVCLRA